MYQKSFYKLSTLLKSLQSQHFVLEKSFWKSFLRSPEGVRCMHKSNKNWIDLFAHELNQCKFTGDGIRLLVKRNTIFNGVKGID